MPCSVGLNNLFLCAIYRQPISTCTRQGRFKQPVCAMPCTTSSGHKNRQPLLGIKTDNLQRVVCNMEHHTMPASPHVSDPIDTIVLFVVRRCFQWLDGIRITLAMGSWRSIWAVLCHAYHILQHVWVWWGSDMWDIWDMEGLGDRVGKNHMLYPDRLGPQTALESSSYGYWHKNIKEIHVGGSK